MRLGRYPISAWFERSEYCYTLSFLIKSLKPDIPHYKTSIGAKRRMTVDRNQNSDRSQQVNRSGFLPNWAYWMTAIAFLLTTSPAWLSGFEMLMHSYGIPPAATAGSALIGSTVHGYTAGEVWLSTLIGELFILVVWRNRNRPYHIRRGQRV